MCLILTQMLIDLRKNLIINPQHLFQMEYQNLLNGIKIITKYFKKVKPRVKLAIIGLGYVGLPLALEFAKKTVTIGFDLNKNRVKQLKFGQDLNLEFTKKEIKSQKK